jgi:predicted Zn finger-like uncharacterized protein
MALATRCPHCGTSFRVAQDQLKLRAGLVRCGACKEIFNGAENLISLESAQRTPGPAAAGTDAAVVAASPASPGTTTVAAASSASFASAAYPASPAYPAYPAYPASPAYPVAPEAVSGNSEATVETGNTAPSVAASELARPPSAIPVAVVPDALPPKNGDDTDLVEVPEPLRHEHANVPAPARPSLVSSGAGHSIARPETSGYRDPDTRPDPLTRMTLMDFAGTGLVAPSHATTGDSAEDGTHDDVGQAIDELKRKPWRRLSRRRASESVDNETSETDAIDAIDEAGIEPEFLQRARRQEHFARRFGTAMAIGSGVLAVTFLFQGAYAFRNHVAAMLPQTRPALLALCKLAACRIDLPAQIDAVSIETNEMQAIADNPDGLQLTALLRNRGTLPQTWPSIELTLNDSNDKPLARRVFGPREYLGADLNIPKGFPANSEQSIKLMLALNQLKPAGYRLYLFYP